MRSIKSNSLPIPLLCPRNAIHQLAYIVNSILFHYHYDLVSHVEHCSVKHFKKLELHSCLYVQSRGCKDRTRPQHIGNWIWSFDDKDFPCVNARSDVSDYYVNHKAASYGSFAVSWLILIFLTFEVVHMFCHVHQW